MKVWLPWKVWFLHKKTLGVAFIYSQTFLELSIISQQKQVIKKVIKKKHCSWKSMKEITVIAWSCCLGVWIPSGLEGISRLLKGLNGY